VWFLGCARSRDSVSCQISDKPHIACNSADLLDMD
jgi:hypothetical protein